jgi:hypothetical protein
MTGAGGPRLDGHPQRMIELRAHRGRINPSVRLTAPLDVEPVRISLEQAFRALHHVNAAVRTRQVGAVLHDDGAAARGLDQAGVDVAQHELLPPFRRVRGKVLARPVLQPA